MTYPPIVIATNNGDIGGGEVMLLRMAEALKGLGHRVSVVAPTEPGDLADAAGAAGFDTIRLPARGRSQWMRALRRWHHTELRRARHDGHGHRLLWCNGLVPAVATAGHPARIVHLHQKPQGAAQLALLPIARAGAIATVVPSTYLQHAFSGSMVLPNWTAPIPVSARRRASDGPYVVGFLGRLSTDKGMVVLTEAIRLLEQRRPGEFRLLVAGEPRFVAPADYALVDHALAGLGDIVERPGWMDRDEFFSSVDALAVPSLFTESFGLGAAEAMAARVPLVVSADGALPEVVGPDGVTVPPGDPAALADALERLLSNPDGDRVDALHRRWQERFSPEAGARNLAQLLADLERRRPVQDHAVKRS